MNLISYNINIVLYLSHRDQETPFDLPKLENFLNKLKNCSRYVWENWENKIL